MKRIRALLIMALFLISVVPLSIAEETGDDDQENIVGRTSSKIGEKKMRLQEGLGKTGDKARERAKIKREVVKERIADVKEREIENPALARIHTLTRSNFSEGRFSEEELAKIKLLRREQAKRIFESNEPEAVKDKLRALKVIENRGEFGKLRSVAKEKMQLAHQRFSAAKSHFKELDSEVKAEKKAFNEARRKLQGCKENCAELESEVLERAKKFALKTGDMVITHLEKIKQQLESNERLSAEKVEAMLERLSSVQSDVEAAIGDVESATTKEELRAASTSISKAWNNVKHFARSYATRHVNSHRGLIITRSEQLEKKLDRVLGIIAEKGVDVEDLDAKVDSFSSQVATAKEFLEASQVKLDDATILKGGDDLTSDDREAIADLVQEARALAKEGQAALKEAHAILTELVRAIHAADPNVDFTTLPEDQVVVEEA